MEIILILGLLGIGALSFIGSAQDAVDELRDNPDELAEQYREAQSQTIKGTPQDDVLEGGVGDDRLYGGAGDDVIRASVGANTLWGHGGNDLLSGLDASGTNASDTLYGGYGMDTLAGDNGDVLTGGGQSDSFLTVFDNDENARVTITDYDPQEDRLVVEFSLPGNSVDATDLRVVDAPNGQGALIKLDGHVIARLDGVKADQVGDVILAQLPTGLRV